MHMQTKLIENIVVAEGTMQFRFEKPEGFEYRAGQSIDLKLINPPETDAEGDVRPFTLASSPDDSYLAITTRMRDTAFKRTLKTMTPGTPMELEGPFGDLTLPEKITRPVVFLAGGIGVTPFYSMSRYAATHQLPHKITLFYSNRRPEDAPFLDELTALQKENPNFTFVGTMTDMEKSAKEWSGEQGYIDANMLKRHLQVEGEPIYYLAGPSSMVAALRTMLNESGVSNDDIHTEEFTGY
jgi:ferredoxin-NADP reductase